MTNADTIPQEFRDRIRAALTGANDSVKDLTEEEKLELAEDGYRIACEVPATPEKDKFFKRLAEKRAEGLKYVHFFSAGHTGANEEEVYAELNRMDEAPVEIDLDLFPDGKTVFTGTNRQL